MPAFLELPLTALPARFAIIASSAALCSCAPVDTFFDAGPKPVIAASNPQPVPTPARRVGPRTAEPPPLRVAGATQVASAVQAAEPMPVRPEAFTGLDPRAMSSLLGKPHSVSKKNVSLVWIYQAPSCVLHVVFYPDIETKQFHVLQYDVLDSGGKPIANTAHCMRALQARIQ